MSGKLSLWLVPRQQDAFVLFYVPPVLPRHDDPTIAHPLCLDGEAHNLFLSVDMDGVGNTVSMASEECY